MRNVIGRWLGAVALAVAWSAGALAAEVKEHVVGDPNAPVTMIEYASLTCPHCAAFHKETLPGIKERYIDTGKVKLVLRDFPLDQAAFSASIIAHCAGDDLYVHFIDAFFANQQTWARAADPIAALIQLAQLGGLPAADAQACLADKSMGDAVLQVRLTGEEQFDVRSTPSFIINGKLYSGNRSVDEFGQIFDEAAK